MRRVLLDENLPLRLRLWLAGVDAVTVQHMGWKGVRNGELIRNAKAAGFDVLLTADRILASAPRTWLPLACVRVTSSDLARLQKSSDRISRACLETAPGTVAVVDI